MAAGKCPDCGSPFGKKANFCKDCGYSFKGGPTTPPSASDADVLRGDPASSAANDDLEGFWAAAEAASTAPTVYPADEGVLDRALNELEDELSPELPGVAAAPRYLSARPAGASYRLEVLNGPDSGKCVVISERGSMTVGAHDGADCVVRGDDTLSRRHASFVVEGGVLYVQDEGSTNGTGLVHWLTGRAAVPDGTVLLLGGTRVRIQKEP